jgi:hypothetical protein
LHEAQVNVVLRMLDVHHRLLTPEEMSKQKDNTGLTPSAHFRTFRELEEPTHEEGFARLERRHFQRAHRPGLPGRFVAFECAKAVDQAAIPTFVFAWTDTAKDEVETAARRLGASALVCPHGGGPPKCWCRPPLPGLLLEACHRHQLSPQASEVVGATETHRMLAATVGARFVEWAPT